MKKVLNVDIPFSTTGKNFKCSCGCGPEDFQTYYSPNIGTAFLICTKCGEKVSTIPFKYKVIALMGEAGSGKDFLLGAALKRFPEYHGIISCTTRPPRENEKDGIHYHFLSEEEFEYRMENNEMFEHVEFRGWYYGTGVDSLSPASINIGVFNVEGIRQLIKDPRVDLKVFWVAAAPKTRLLRQLNREKNPDVEEVIRRFRTDEEDFATVDFDYEVINNDNLTFSETLGEIQRLVWAK